MSTRIAFHVQPSASQLWSHALSPDTMVWSAPRGHRTARVRDRERALQRRTRLIRG